MVLPPRFRTAVSGAYQKDSWHVISALGAQLPVDGDDNVHSLFYNVHLDHAFSLGSDWFRFLVPFTELNLLHYIDSGDGSQTVTLSGNQLSTRIGLFRMPTGDGPVFVVQSAEGAARVAKYRRQAGVSP